jgi:hypothetical protein
MNNPRVYTLAGGQHAHGHVFFFCRVVFKQKTNEYILQFAAQKSFD